MVNIFSPVFNVVQNMFKNVSDGAYRFEFTKEMDIKITVLWDIIPCTLIS
jgi:hypothetical protein